MLFDLRGRRRNVVKVVYAVLAILMGASLFLTVGPVSLSNLFGGGGGGGGAVAKAAEEQVERYETKLTKNPEDPNALLGLTKAQISLGQATVSGNPETGEIEASLETRQQLEKASESWSKYLEVVDEPNIVAAQQVASALFTLGQISQTNQIAANMQAAADTQKLVVEKRPNLGTLSNYAIYSIFAFDYATAEKAANRVEKLATSKFERENFENQFEERTKLAKQFQRELAQTNKQNKGSGKEAIENPLSGVGGVGLGE